MKRLPLYLLLKGRRSARERALEHSRKWMSGLVKTLVATLVLGLISLVTWLGVLSAQVTRNLPSIDTLPILLDRQNGELLQPTRVIDRNGQVILFTYQDSEASREFLSVDPLEEDHFSPQLVRTVVAALQPGFWTDPGFDLGHLLDGKPATLAEKLVSDLLLWSEPPSNLRSLRMRVLASQVTSKYGGKRVLEWYLNSAWFGSYTFGAESASQLYLGKSSRELTLAESTFLVAVMQNPAVNPLDAPATAQDRQVELLGELLDKGLILPQEYDAAIAEEIRLADVRNPPPSIARGFISLVEEELNPELGSLHLQRGGLIIHTTLDGDLQKQLVCTSTAQLIRLQYNGISGVAPEGTECPVALQLPTQSFDVLPADSLAAGGLVMSPENGEVLAYLEPLTLSGEVLEDRGYEPGSLLSVVAALSAFSRGYSPSSLTWDIPPASDSSIAGLIPEATTFHGAVNLRSAVVHDYLVPIANIVEEIGAGNTWDNGRMIGLYSLDSAPDDASPLAKGSTVSLLEVGSAFSTLANSGMRVGWLDAATQQVKPTTVLNVFTLDGKVLADHSNPQRTVVLDENLAYLVNRMLSDENARWDIPGAASLLDVGSPSAVKMASANDHRQIWTVGYSPQRLVLTWMGLIDDINIGIRLDEGMTAGVWNALYSYGTSELLFNGWPKPAGISEVRVCSPSGMLPTPSCPTVVSEDFLAGNEPTQPDTLFSKLKINRETGKLATVFTPPELVEERVYVNFPSEARAWAAANGMSLPPTEYDTIQPGAVDPEVVISAPNLSSMVSSMVIIEGTAVADNFASYTIQVGEGINPETWLQVASSTRQVKDGILAEWDSTGLSGQYVIRLSVVDGQNRVKMAYTLVNVVNSQP